MMSTRSARWAVALLAALMLGGCAAGRPAAVPTGRAGATATDVMFAQMMVPHHRQALALVGLVPGRAVRPEVAMLAAAVGTTQAAEVETMAGWLRDRGHPTEADPGSHAAHGGLPETSVAELAALARLSGAAFEPAFRNLLVAHQDDAIQLARMELAVGSDPVLRDLADRIVRSRSAQITQLLSYVD